MDKAPDAYRTISEVAEDLDLPQHVLRFWETRFGQIKPLKRGGGRRYYRPDDVELLKGIRHLLYKEGYTIKGVQRILKEQGVKAVQAFVRETLAAPAGDYAAIPEPPRMAQPLPAVSDDFDDEDETGPPFETGDFAPPEPEPERVAAPRPVAASPAPPPRSQPLQPGSGQVSMFRGGVKQGENPAGSLGDFSNRIRERIDSAPPADSGVPGADGADLLRLALEDLIACRARIDQILARRQA